MGYFYNWIRKSKYQAKEGNQWTLKELLIQISNELDPVGPRVVGSTLKIDDQDDICIIFIRNRFPPKDKMVEINGSITRSTENNEEFIGDLFSLGKQYFGDKTRPLGIHKDQAWEGSQIQSQLREFYLPLMQEILKIPVGRLTPSRLEEITAKLKAKQI